MAVSSKQARIDAKRQDILIECKSLSDQNCHYLWGAQGQKPTTKDTNPNDVRYAPVVLDEKRLEETTFCAATICANSPHGHYISYVCTGRCGDTNHKDYPVHTVVSHTGYGELRKFIKQYKGNEHAQLAWGPQATPRKVLGGDITNYMTSVPKDLTNHVVWGEGCDDTLHFDCGGFVRYVIAKVCGVSLHTVTGMTRNPHKKNEWGGLLSRTLAPNEEILPGDILYWGHHIAFAIGDGHETVSSHSHNVAQAECAVFGVNYGKSHDEVCKKVFRLTDSTLLGP